MRQHAHTRAAWTLGALGALLAALALGGCQSGAVGPTPTTIPSPTITLIPTATDGGPVAPQVAQQFPGCPAVPVQPNQPAYTTIGGLQVSTPQRALDYPSTLLPNNLPSAPYALPSSAVTAYAPSLPVNPYLQPGYVIQLCNQTSAPQTLDNLTVTIATFTPSSGPVAVWHICQDGPYDPATNQSTGGCGGAIGGVTDITAPFTDNQSGATVAVSGLVLPLTVQPGMSVPLAVAVTGLTAQGTYTLLFGVIPHGASPRNIAPGDGSFLIAPNAAIWTGTACQSGAMRAKIPAATSGAYYVCPPGA